MSSRYENSKICFKAILGGKFALVELNVHHESEKENSNEKFRLDNNTIER